MEVSPEPPHPQSQAGCGRWLESPPVAPQNFVDELTVLLTDDVTDLAKCRHHVSEGRLNFRTLEGRRRIDL